MPKDDKKEADPDEPQSDLESEYAQSLSGDSVSAESGDGGEDWQAALRADLRRTRAAAKAKAKAAAKASSSGAPQIVPSPPVPVPGVTTAKGGYLMRNAKRIGRVYSLPFSARPSAHVACFHPCHSQCSKWVVLQTVQNIRNLDRWAAAQDAYATSEAHLGDWITIAMGP